MGSLKVTKDAKAFLIARLRVTAAPQLSALQTSQLLHTVI